MQNFVKTKIIATVGPATNTKEKIKALIEAGARIFRINSSHETKEIHTERIRMIRELSKEMGIYLPIMLDLQGPKIRIGTLKEPINLEDGTVVKLQPALEMTNPDIIPVDYSGIINDVNKGDKVLLDDGKLELEVLSKTSKIIEAKVIHGGLLKSRKGLNIPGTTASLSAVTERDVEFIKFAVEQDLAYIALSFVREKDDVIKAKKYVNKFKGDIPIIAKIEKPQAVDNLNSIILASDGVMVARGDLGIEISPEKVPIVQKQIIDEANAQRKAVIVATQMLESMINAPIPTRAEASDVANAIIDGADAVMLSGETAAGEFPAEAVKMMSLIAENVENSHLIKLNQYTHKAKELYDPNPQAIAAAVIRMLDEIEINCIVSFTKSGFTGKLLSKAKPSVPTITVSNNKKTCERLNLFWGVIPCYMDFEGNFTEDFLYKVDQLMMNETFLEAGDKIIMTGGIPSLAIEKTNFLRLHQVGSTATMY